MSIFSLWKKKKTGAPDNNSREESASVRNLNKQVKLLEGINLSYINMIEDLNKQVAKQNKGNMEEKLIDMFANIFIPNNNNSPPSPLATPTPPAITINDESDTAQITEYSEENIKKVLSNVNEKVLKYSVGQGDDYLRRQAISFIPGITPDSLDKVVKVAKEMII